MAALTKQQIATLDKQEQEIDAVFASIAGVLNKRGLERLTKKKLTQAMTFLNKASNLLATLTDDDEEEEGEDD